MVAGAATVFLWAGLGTGLYEIIPGFIVNLIVAVLVSLATHRSNAEIEREFTETGAGDRSPGHGRNGSGARDVR